MHARLLTQVSADKPKVLLIGPDSWVQTEVSKQFRQFDFEVVAATFAQTTSTLIVSESWYKIVFLVGWESYFFDDAQKTLASLELLTSRLQTVQTTLSVRPDSKNAVVCISPNWSFFVDQDEKIAKICGALRSFQIAAVTRCNVLHMVLVQNPFLPQQVLVSQPNLVPPLDFILQSRRSGKIIFFDTKLSLLGETAFKKLIRDLLKRPYYEEKYSLLVGNSFPIKQVIQDLIRRSYVQFGINLQEQIAHFVDSRPKHALFAEITKLELSSTQNKYAESLPQIIAPVFEVLFPTSTAFNQETLVQTQQQIQSHTPQPNLTVQQAVPEPVRLVPVHKPPKPIKQKAEPRKTTVAQQTARFKPVSKPPLEKIQQHYTLPQVSQDKAVLQSSRVAETVKKNNTAIDDKLTALFSQERVAKKIDHLHGLKEETKQATQKNKKRKAAFYIGISISAVALFVIVLSTIFLFSTYLLKQSIFAYFSTLAEFRTNQAALSTTNYGTSKATTSPPFYSQFPTLLKLKRNIVAVQLEVYSYFLPGAFFYESSNLVDIANNLDNLQKEISTITLKQQNQVVSALGSTTGVTSFVDSNQSKQVETQTTYERISRLSAQIEELTEKEQQKSQKETLKAISAIISKQRAALLMYQQFEPLLPTLLGLEGKRSYALVLQNEQELRATGGFIQAVAILTFDAGTLIDSQVFSSYQLDNQLAAIVEPPADLKIQLGEDRFYLRDANWNPDFPTSATQIAWFIEQTLNKKVDGVIALNIHALQDVLAEIGPVSLPQYNEIITDKNIFERMEFHSEVTLVETSESNEYAVVLLRALLQKITTLTQDSVGGFLAGLRTALYEKQLLIHFTKKDESDIVTALGWNGVLLSPACPTQLSVAPCLVDSLAVIDSNVGVNKANAHIKRQDRHTVLLGTEAAHHSHSIVLQNTAQSNAWPKGSYQSYLRFYIPITATLKGVQVNGQNIDDSELIQENVQGAGVLGAGNGGASYKIIGLRTTTPIKSETKIDFEYFTPLLPEQIAVTSDQSSVSFNSSSDAKIASSQTQTKEVSYVLYIQKQPGIDSPLSAVSLSYPPSLTPVVIAPQAETDLDSITYTNLGPDHIFVGAMFKKK